MRGFPSAIFRRKKKDGNMSIIVDLKHFIKHIKYNKSKMKYFADALKFIQPYC